MSDQEVKETSRYARKQITVRGLMKGDYKPNAKKLMADVGVMWDLHGHTDRIEEQKFVDKTVLVDGEELPSGLTPSESAWVLALAEKHGIDIGITEVERVSTPDLPYTESPVRFSIVNRDTRDDWLDASHTVGDTSITVTMSRSRKELKITIEGKSKDDVTSDDVESWIKYVLDKVRLALLEAGFEEGDLDVDCEVIMGAEREAKCDPGLMRTLIIPLNEVSQ